MADLLTAAPIRPRVLSSAVLLRRALALLHAEHPELSDAQLVDLWVEVTDAAFTAWQAHAAPAADHAAFLTLTGGDA